jgi:hypothetical protein
MTRIPRDPELQRAFDRYSLSMQRYKTVLNNVPTHQQPPRLPALKKPHDVASLKKRADALDARSAYWKQATNNRASGQREQKPEHLPPHLRVLQQPPADCNPETNRLTQFELKAGQLKYAGQRKADEVYSPCTAFVVNMLTGPQRPPNSGRHAHGDVPKSDKRAITPETMLMEHSTASQAMPCDLVPTQRSVQNRHAGIEHRTDAQQRIEIRRDERFPPAMNPPSERQL